MGFKLSQLTDPGGFHSSIGQSLGLDNLSGDQQAIFDPVGIFSDGKGGFLGGVSQRIDAGDSDFLGIGDAIVGNRASPLDWLGSPLTAEDPAKRNIARMGARAFGLWALAGAAAGAGGTEAGTAGGAGSNSSAGMFDIGAADRLDYSLGPNSGASNYPTFSSLPSMASSPDNTSIDSSGFGSDFDMSGFADPNFAAGGDIFLPDMASNAGMPGYGYMPGEAGGMPGGIQDYWRKLLQGMKAGKGATGTGGAMRGYMGIGSGLYGLYQANQMKKLSQQAMDRSDPFGPERAQYAQRLRELYADPSGVQNLPGYKAGLQAVERKMASQGYNNSGNMMLALHDYGGRAFDSEANRLGTLAGAGMQPDARAAIMARQGASDLTSRSLASMAFGANSF